MSWSGKRAEAGGNEVSACLRLPGKAKEEWKDSDSFIVTSHLIKEIV